MVDVLLEDDLGWLLKTRKDRHFPSLLFEAAEVNTEKRTPGVLLPYKKLPVIVLLHCLVTTNHTVSDHYDLFLFSRLIQ